MSVQTGLQAVPAFSAAFLSTTKIPDTTILPNNCGKTVCPTLLEFGFEPAKSNYDDAFRASPVSSHKIIQINSKTENRSAGDAKKNLLQLNPIHFVNKNVQIARDARRTGDFASAILAYKHVAQRLEEPAEENHSALLYSVVPNGTQLLSEALFGITALSEEKVFGIDSIEGTAPAADNIERLALHTLELEALAKSHEGKHIYGATRLDIARSKILEAFNLMQHASSAEVQHDSLYWRVEKIVNEAICPKKRGGEIIAPALVDPKGSLEEAETHFLGGLLIIEALARRMELAQKGKNHNAVEKFADRITSYLSGIYDSHFKKNKETERYASIIGEIDQHVQLFARYEAEIAILKYKLGLGYHALNRVRSIVEGTLDHTVAATTLREHEYFKNFFDHGRLLHTDDIAESAAEGAFWRRMQAAFAYAHSPSLKNSLISGAVGMVIGVGLAALTGNPDVGWVTGGAGASIVEGAYELYNGWHTRQARDAAKMGTNRISGQQTAVDVIKFGGKRVATAFVWSLPSAALAVGPEFVSTVGETFANIPSGYATAFSRLADCPESLFPPLSGTDVLSDIAHIGYQTYTKLAGAIFLANLFSDKARKLTKIIAPFFIPGALMFSADLGLAIAPPDALTDPQGAWVDRIWRATIVGLEMLFMMLTTGLAPLAKTRSVAESFKSLGNTLLPIKGNADYNLPLAAMIVTGLSSPLGGVFQQGLMRPEDIPLIAAQGAAITTGLLGLTLGMSGILKRQIPIGASIKRAVKDVQVARANEAERIKNGETLDVTTGLWRYPYEALRGFGSAFNVGYVRNRVLRIPGPDMVASAGRLIIGGGDWDNNRGQIAMSTINGISGNPYWDSTYPAASGTQPEEASFINAVNKAILTRRRIESDRKNGLIVTPEEEAKAEKDWTDALEIMNDFLRKSGQVIHPFHFFLPHNSLMDRLWPLYSFIKPIAYPKFPQSPNPFMYASIYQVLADHVGSDMSEEELRADEEKLSAEQFELVLEYIKSYATDTKVYHVMRSLIKTMLLARNSERFGKRIESFFFKENPHLFSLLSIDPDKEELRAFEERFSRISRARVRDIVKQSPDTYEDRIRRYHPSNGNGNGSKGHDLDGMFQTIVNPAAAALAAVTPPAGATAKPASEEERTEDTPPGIRI